MSDSESIKKMLRSVLQSSKTGVSVNKLQGEYRSLCGEFIPLKKLGFSRLEDYLQSIPSVVHLVYRMGELKCFAAVCEETAHIAELVARQKSAKKCGRYKVVNCTMRFKPSNPYILNVRPRSSLRQPSAAGDSNWSSNRYRPQGACGGFSAAGDYRKLDPKLSSITPVEHRQPVPKPAPQTAVKQWVPERQGSFENSWKTKDDPPKKVLRAEPSNLKLQSCQYDVELVQSRMTQLLRKYCSGVWMSKLSGVYREMFGQELHPQVQINLEQWTHVCLVEKPSTNSRADRLIYPPVPSKPETVPPHSTTNTLLTSCNNSSTVTTPISSPPSTPEQPHPDPFPYPTPRTSPPTPKPRTSPKNPVAKPTFIFPSQPVAGLSANPPSVSLRSPAHNPALAPRLSPFAGLAASTNASSPTTDLNHNKNMPPLAPTLTSPAKTNTSPLSSTSMPGPDILPLLKVTFSTSSDPVPRPPSQSSAPVMSADVSQKLKDLLSKYSHGLWVHGLPQLFMDTFKTPFPDHILHNLSLLMDMCDVEYPVPGDKTKAILYNSSRADMDAEHRAESQQCRSHFLPSGLRVLSPVIPPCLLLPSEQFPSVLVTEAMSSSVVTIRYVGENYSNAQEAMEESMRPFYSSSPHLPVSRPVVGQLVAVRGEEVEELARAQVMEIMDPNKIKVYYVDYGFSVETSRTNLLELHQDFLSLPFQATNVKLAGLDTFSAHPEVLSSLDTLAVGKILLMETLELSEDKTMPVAVLYDTSQDDDLNINSACLKALQDKSMNNSLTVNATYKDLCVTNVCANGIIHCRLPCRGSTRLKKLLEDTDIILKSQMTSELLVSRPFSGKFCLARHRGRWSRAEITNMYGNRVMEILFIDFGVPATVEVTDLREIPPVFLKDFTIIPPQVIKCRLAELTVPDGDWSQEAVQWVKEAVMGSEDGKIKISKLDQHKGDSLVYVYLFIGTDSQDLDKSINHQLVQSELWQKLTTKHSNRVTRRSAGDPGLSELVDGLTLNIPVPNQTIKAATQPLSSAGDSSLQDLTTKTAQPLLMPPPLELPQAGQNMDVFVPVACHPGYFVLQPWQDLHKLVVLMGEMILYYNQAGKSDAAMHIEKGGVYAAKIDKNWHRVQVKGILTNGLVSVYELDYGKHELVRNTLIQPLIEEFRQLPFQAIAAQLAGLTHIHWSEETSMLFRNHVEDRALVAQVESVQEASEVKGQLWERKLTVYLVDTTLDEKDLWIHSIMADLSGELSSAA
ncbi:tudor domain-containing protein 7A-like isoform X2 [Notolabrus celidotus]|uniref:tudor domain-containing protein 7A-like isoform X2 n=1 Tax=Notolabrus celidotus TaxID=1203425 RepID=UPI00148F6197|nr:tudor domain-containing protein 7A-like isoform X2 [Notolabrus celidotus]